MSTSTGPHIPLRALREAHGLTSTDLADRISELLDAPVDSSTLRNVELGHKSPSPGLLRAWALALGIKPCDIRQAQDLRDYLLDREPEATAA